MSERALRRVSNNINFYTRRGATAQTPHAGYVPPRARTHQDSSVQFRAEQDTDGNGRMARLPLLGGAPPLTCFDSTRAAIADVSTPTPWRTMRYGGGMSRIMSATHAFRWSREGMMQVLLRIMLS